MTRLILARHGETVANREFRYIGRRDDPLSEKGQEQARQLAPTGSDAASGGNLQ
jgi:broad specificity phosphatase PhoE